MTDQDLVAKKLALIETSVRELRTLARPDEIQRDVRELRFVAYTLQIAIQAALDVAAHIVTDERLGEPRTNRDLFEGLGDRPRWGSPARGTITCSMAPYATAFAAQAMQRSPAGGR